MSEADAVAAVLFVGLTMYAVFGGADFGAGLWSLLAGGGERGRRPRQMIDSAIGPVWEANHVWLIFVLVVLWTGFSSAFEAIFSTLFIPLSLAALGIVLRGSGFAFHHTTRRARGREAAELLFGLSSVLTPFFMGTVVGAIVGRPRPGRKRGRRQRHELAQPALDRDRIRSSSPRAPTSQRCSSSTSHAAPTSRTSSDTSPPARSLPPSSPARSRSSA